MTDESMVEHRIEHRITKVEVQLKHLDDDAKLRFQQIEQINAKLDKIDAEFSRYRGSVGGILLVVTAVVTFFKLFWGDIMEKIQ
jgi:hypothetical protein